MTDVITRLSSPTVVIADLVTVERYEPEHALGNILHPKMNGSGFNVTYKPARLRGGTMVLLFADAAAAHAAAALLVTSYRFTLESDEPEADMTFVVGRPGGSGSLRPRPGEGLEWLVDVPFQEVDA